MSKINFPKKQEQRLIPKYLLEYSEELVKNHPDPSESWGGGSGGDYTAGTGIDIENKVISVDNTVAMKTDIPDVSDFVTSTELGNELAYYELKSEAFSGSYSDLSNKPDLSVYELKEDAFTGDYDDLTNKPDLSVYELAADAFSGDYNDLTNKPTIPDAVSGTNDGTNWTTITIGNTTKNIPTGGSTYTAGTWIGITNDTINVSNPYISLIDGNNLPRVMISDHTNGTTPSFNNAKYCNISPLGFGINDRTKSQPTGGPSSNTYTYYNWDKITFDGTWDLALPTKSGTIAVTSDIPTATSDLTNDSGFITGITSSDVTTALGYTPGTSNFSGSYNDLTNKPNLSIYAKSADLATVATTGSYNDLSNKPTIPTVPTNISAFTNDSGYITSADLPTNYVTTDTVQTITGAKTYRNILYGQRDDGSNCYRIYNNNTNGLLFAVYSADSTTRTIYTLPNYTTNGDKTIATLDDIPTIPTNVSAFTNDAGYITGITSSDVTTALGYTPGTSNFDGAYNSLTGKPDLSIYAQTANLGTAAFIDEDRLSIDYSQLTNTPTIPTVPTLETGTITALSGVDRANNMYAYRYGKIAIVTFNIRATSGTRDLLTLPWAPAQVWSVSLAFSNTEARRASIDTTGKLYLDAALTAQGWINATITYVTD